MSSTPQTLIVQEPAPLIVEIPAVQYETPPEEPETNIHALISDIAAEYDISSTTLDNLVWSESRYNPDATGDGNRAFGLTQIHLNYWDVTEEEARDPVFNLTFAAQKIANDDEYLWTSCNCYSLVKTRVANLPRIVEIVPNSNLKIGAVAIFQYGSVKHLAYVTSMGENGTFIVQEANYKPCLIGTRTIHTSDSHLQGFWEKK